MQETTLLEIKKHFDALLELQDKDPETFESLMDMHEEKYSIPHCVRR